MTDASIPPLKTLAVLSGEGWTPPTPTGTYTMLVLGAGAAGLAVARGAAELGARVALVERGALGGSRLHAAGAPVRALVHAARALPRDDVGDEDWAFRTVMARVDLVRRTLAAEIAPERLRDQGIDVYFGDGEFTGRHALTVNGAELKFQRACIATGCRLVPPNFEGVDQVRPLTHDELFGLGDRPARLAIMGGDPIGCELAQAFARLGSRVTLVEAAPRLLAGEDLEGAELLAGALERDGVDLRLGSRIVLGERSPTGALLTLETGEAGGRIEVDHVLTPRTRLPVVRGLGLDALGVESDPRLGIHVDDRMRTSNAGVYAAGEVCIGEKYSHAAEATGRLVVRNALAFGRAAKSSLHLPRCIHTTPGLAHVGADPASATDGHRMRTVTVPFSEVDGSVIGAALEGRSAQGFVKLHVDDKHRVCGGTVAGQEAEELIMPLTMAVASRMTVSMLAEVVSPYPARADIFRVAAARLEGERQRGERGGLLARWLSWGP